MKKQILTLAGVLSLLFVAGSAHAQLVQMQANIPFEFKIVNKTLPAGEYKIVPDGTLSSNVMRIENYRGTPVALVVVRRSETRHNGETNAFVFNRYGDQYFLSNLKLLGESIRWEFPRGKAETEQAQASQASEVLVASER